MTVIAVPSILKEKFGEAAAQALVDLIRQVEENAKDRTIEIVEERFVRRLGGGGVVHRELARAIEGGGDVRGQRRGCKNKRK